MAIRLEVPQWYPPIVKSVAKDRLIGYGGRQTKEGGA